MVCCSFSLIFVPFQNDGSGRPATQRVTVTTLLISPGIKPSSIGVLQRRHWGAGFMAKSGAAAQRTAGAVRVVVVHELKGLC